jgi:polyhydroxyalkanoate synthesis regulator phasin
MSVNIMVHVEYDKASFELSQEKQTEHCSDLYRTLNIGDEATVFLTDGQARQLCDELEKKLYEAPTYAELNEECEKLAGRVEELEDKIRDLKEGPYSPEEYDLNCKPQ